MPRLLLLRHAKSSWAIAGQPDFDRSLNSRGRAAAAAMGAFMAEHGLSPQRVVCSSAQRARETMALLLPHLADDMKVNFTRRLYEADTDGCLTAAREGGATANTAMLVGHNPALQELASLLAPIGDAVGLAEIHDKFPTAGLAVIDFDAARLSDIGPGAGRLIAFHTPKSIGAAE
jgi:phosphohistidine phosphatase